MGDDGSEGGAASVVKSRVNVRRKVVMRQKILCVCKRAANALAGVVGLEVCKIRGTSRAWS
jgi:hypothetical protein